MNGLGCFSAMNGSMNSQCNQPASACTNGCQHIAAISSTITTMVAAPRMSVAR